MAKTPPQNSSLSDSKAAGLYRICTLSKHQAKKESYTDSLMLDHGGNVAEATNANNLDNNFEVCDLIKDLSLSYEKLVGKN